MDVKHVTTLQQHPKHYYRHGKHTAYYLYIYIPNILQQLDDTVTRAVVELVVVVTQKPDDICWCATVVH